MTACLGEPSHITRLEHAQARLTLSYNRRGDLAIHLVSPMGTRSTLLAARCLPSPLPSLPCPSYSHTSVRVLTPSWTCHRVLVATMFFLVEVLLALEEGRFGPRDCPTSKESLASTHYVPVVCLPVSRLCTFPEFSG